MKRSLFTVIALLLALVFAAPAFSAISTPIVRVNLIRQAIITQEQLDESLAEYKESYGEDVEAATVLDSLIAEELMNQAFERDGFVLTDDQKNELLANQKTAIEEQVGQALTDEQFAALIMNTYGVDVDYFKEYIAQQYLLRSYIMTKKADMINNTDINPTTEQVEAFFKKNAASFISSENVKLSHIYFNTDEDKEAALKKANDVLAQIKAGTISFEKAVAEYSEDTGSVDKAGEIGWLAIDQTEYITAMGQNFFDKVFALEAGQISDEVIESVQGLHIVKVTVHNPTKLLGLDDKIYPWEDVTVRDYITSLFAQQNYETLLNNAYLAVLNDLKAEASIKYLKTI